MKIIISTFLYTVNGIPNVTYTGTLITDKEVKILFSNNLDYINEDVASYVASIHALGINKREGKYYDIYCKSKKAKEWIEKKSFNQDQISDSRTSQFIKRSSLFLLDQKKDLIIYLYE